MLKPIENVIKIILKKREVTNMKSTLNNIQINNEANLGFISGINKSYQLNAYPVKQGNGLNLQLNNVSDNTQAKYEMNSDFMFGNLEKN
jgi:hypothetical protein